MKNKLPNVVINKKEHHGLNSPANEWFRGLLNKEIVNSIEVLSSKKYNFINRNKALKILNDHYENKWQHDDTLEIYSTANWIKMEILNEFKKQYSNNGYIKINNFLEKDITKINNEFKKIIKVQLEKLIKNQKTKN